MSSDCDPMGDRNRSPKGIPDNLEFMVLGLGLFWILLGRFLID